MGDIAIKVQGLGKQYQIGAAQGRYQTLREAILRTASAPVRWVKGERQENSTIWALDDVSFEVKHGEVIGVIGRNGAGKSTLLKILSRITKPTRGQIDLYGRVGSLLEVGTGFHPELTGRENVFLNGAILGMTRREIQRKFDEIVDFSGVEKFIDTPVKHYSSGMQVRLAFSVAAHLEPEILLIDEVLAVGDAEFQKKSLGKMGEVSKSGRTVLFVSHNMTAVKTLCERGIWLDHGSTKLIGPAVDVISNYMKVNFSKNLIKEWELSDAPGNDYFQLYKIAVHPANGKQINMGDPIELEIVFNKSSKQIFQTDVTFHLIDELGNLVFVGSTAQAMEKNELGDGKYVIRCKIPEKLMHEGIYTLKRLLFVKDRGSVLFEINDAISFEVVNPGRSQLGWMGHGKSKEGIVRPQLDWKISALNQVNQSIIKE